MGNGWGNLWGCLHQVASFVSFFTGEKSSVLIANNKFKCDYEMVVIDEAYADGIPDNNY